MKKIWNFLKWATINFSVLGLFIQGNMLLLNTGERGYTLYIGETMFWLVSLGTSFLGIIFWILSKNVIPINIHRGKNTRLNLKEVVDMDLNTLEKIAKSHIPRWLDQIYDVSVLIIMVYFNYIWLPLFYMAHIVSLVIIQDESKKLISSHLSQVEKRETQQEMINRLTPKKEE